MTETEPTAVSIRYEVNEIDGAQAEAITFSTRTAAEAHYRQSLQALAPGHVLELTEVQVLAVYEPGGGDWAEPTPPSEARGLGR